MESIALVLRCQCYVCNVSLQKVVPVRDLCHWRTLVLVLPAESVLFLSVLAKRPSVLLTEVCPSIETILMIDFLLIHSREMTVQDILAAMDYRFRDTTYNKVMDKVNVTIASQCFVLIGRSTDIFHDDMVQGHSFPFHMGNFHFQFFLSSLDI